MSSFLVEMSLRFLVVSLCVYGVVFVPIGEHTLYEHLARIAATDPAQQLEDEIDGAVTEVRRQVQGGIDGIPTARDMLFGD